MKAKLISVGVLLVVVLWFVSFLMGVNDPPVDHGKIIASSTLHTTECKGWSVGSWGDSKCENVRTKDVVFEDGYTASVEISRVRIDK